MTMTIERLQARLDELLDDPDVDYQTPIHIVSPDGFVSEIETVNLDGNGHAYIDPIKKGMWKDEDTTL